jgi:hypothetical protein
VGSLSDTLLFRLVRGLKDKYRLGDGQETERLEKRMSGEQDDIVGEDSTPNDGDEDENTTLGEESIVLISY